MRIEPISYTLPCKSRQNTYELINKVLDEMPQPRRAHMYDEEFLNELMLGLCIHLVENFKRVKKRVYNLAKSVFSR